MTIKPIVPVLFPYADISTGLITEHDCNLLVNANTEQAVFVAEYKEGVFICLQEDDEDFRESLDYLKSVGHSEQFCALLTNVRAWGFQYLRLDSDGLMTTPISLPTTPEEKERAEYIRSLVDWSRGYKKMPGSSYRSEFKELAEFVVALRGGNLDDNDWTRIGELLDAAEAA